MVNGERRVLVFDSGVGGLSVFDAIAASGHAFELDYAADNAWLPYGLKSDEALRARVPALLSRLVEQWAPDAVVVACNTASTIALAEVRAALSVPVVGVVPPIKPAAALTKTGTIGLLATHGQQAGISGILSGALGRAGGWRLGFLAGLVASGVVAFFVAPERLGVPSGVGLPGSGKRTSAGAHRAAASSGANCASTKNSDQRPTCVQ